MMRASYETVLADLRLLQKLALYEPMVIGTPPLGIDIDSSDIDIACTAADLEQFKSDVTKTFGNEAEFCVGNIQRLPEPAVRAAFIAEGWEIELFCQSIPIAKQWGVRHFLVELRLLTLKPALRSKVIELKKSGLKTEPAFAKILNLAGDPYEAMLELEDLPDEELVALST
ncbi:MAG: DUF4269 domain-containing protein [Woeseiaceae bacterium]